MTWSDALDRYAARLEAVVAALADGRVDDVPPFEPPPRLGPLPSGERRRAEELLGQSAALEREIARRMHAIATRRTAADSAPRFVDAMT